MNYNRIKKLQNEYGYLEMQGLINSGTAWSMQGSIGRQAMGCLESGACMLPRETYKDYYGNRIPSRDELKKGTKGTYQNCKEFWTKVYEGEIYLENHETN